LWHIPVILALGRQMKEVQSQPGLHDQTPASTHARVTHMHAHMRTHTCAHTYAHTHNTQTHVRTRTRNVQ
jgi:hypothetical protein